MTVAPQDGGMRGAGLAITLAGILALALGSVAAPAGAEEAVSKPAAVESFKDWELFCPSPKPKDQPRICEVRTIIKGKQGARLGALAIAVSPDPGAKADTIVATALLPLGVDLALAPALDVGDGKPMVLQFRRCLQRGCEAVAPISADQVASLRSGAMAKVAVGIGGGKTAVLEFSLQGFSAAHDAMLQRVRKS